MVGEKKEGDSQNRLSLEKRRLGRTEIWVSPICLGSLNLDPHGAPDKETLSTALRSQIHFVDTSGNYGDGGSEGLVGEILEEHLRDFPEDRNSIVLCTKVGVVRGHQWQKLQSRKKQRSGFHPISSHHGYCLMPEYIEHQISLSLRRLKVSKIEIALIQNPEHLLKILGSKEKFFKHLRRTFEHLEVEVARGRIGHYGISTSAFLKKEIDPNYLCLQEIFDMAPSITKNHHFSVIQIPFNLFETNSIFLKNQKGQTCLNAAKDLDLGVMTYRPLTSHHRDKVHHLITFPGKDEVSIKGDLHRTLIGVLKMEKEIFNQLPQHKELKWGHLLRNHLHKISDWWKWNSYLQKQILPSLQESINKLPPTNHWDQWKVQYVEETQSLFSLITDSLKGIANLRTNQICNYLNQNCQSLSMDEKLSNQVTKLYLSLPQIHSVVVGLSKPEYVLDLTEIQKLPNVHSSMEVFKNIKNQF